MMSVHPEPESRPAVAGTKLVLGAFFLLLGLLLTADNLGLADADEILRYWSILLVALGLVQIGRRGGRVLGAVLLFAGVWILAYNLGFFPFTLFDLWPLILIGIGLSLVARAVGGDGRTPRQAAGDGESTGGLAILATRRITPSAHPYRGGRAAAFLGTCELYLPGSDPGDEPAVIEALAFWGAVIIIVPEGWEVTGDVLPIMGGFESKIGPASTEGRRRVIVRGLALMGGIEVKNPERREA